jgi:hypothetical protein
MNVRNRQASKSYVFLALALPAVACTAPSRVLDVDGVERSEPDALERLRSRQLLRFFVDGVEDHLPLSFVDDTDQFGALPDDLVSLLSSECKFREWRAANPAAALEDYDTPPAECEAAYGSAMLGCSRYLCRASRTSCEVNVLLELASATQFVTLHEYEEATNEEVRFPPQDRATRAALREAAYLHARKGWDTAGSAVITFDTSEGDCLTNFLPGMDAPPKPDRIDVIYVHARDLYELGVEAAYDAFRDYLALADGEYGRRSSFDDAASSAEAIRMHAARFLVGGGWGPNVGSLSTFKRDNPATVGFCTRPELSPEAMNAVRLIRESGLSPDTVDPNAAMPTDLDTFIGLLDLWVSLLRSESPMTIPTPDDFLRANALESQDIAEARAYLGQEYAAFARDTSRVVPGREVPTIAADLHAATVEPPRAPDPVYYASIARDVGLEQALGSTGITDLRQNAGGDPSVAAWGHGVRALAAQIESVSAGAPMSLVGTMEDTSARLMRDAEGESSGRMFVGNIPGTTESLDILVVSPHLEAEVVVLTTTAALSCALTGFIEGTSCSWGSDVAPAIVSPFGDPPDPSVWEAATGMTAELASFPTYYHRAPFAADMLPDTDRIYVIVRKAGAIQNDPGGYDALGSAWIHTGESTYYYVHLNPSLDRRAGAALTPSTDWCTHPQVSCADDARIDARLPLEDEITETNSDSAFENSWSRYLERAHAAAAEADHQARTVLDLQLSIADRTDQAMSELEDICGEGVSVDPFRTELFERSEDPLEFLEGESEDPRADLLLSCLAESQVLPYVSLGDHELCAWHMEGGGLCALEEDLEATVALDCPRFVRPELDYDSGDINCEIPSGGMETYAAIPITGDALLGLVPSPEAELGTVAPAGDLCARVRTLRTLSADPMATAAQVEVAKAYVFAGSEFFSPSNVQGIASSVRWEAAPGTNSTIFFNSRPVIRTGTLVSGPASTGICAPLGDTTWRDRYDCGADESSLFCLKVDCADDQTRATLNARLARAATFARWLGQQGVGGFRAPGSVNHEGCGNTTEGTPITFQDAFGGHSVGQFGRTDDSEVEYFCNDDGTGVDLWRYVVPSGTGTITLGCNQECFPDDHDEQNGVKFAPIGDGAYGQGEVDRYRLSRNREFAARLLRDLETMSVTTPGSPLSDFRNGRLHRVWPVGHQTEFAWFAADDDGDSPVGVSQFFANRQAISDEEVFDALEVLCEAGQVREADLSADVGFLSSTEAIDNMADTIEQVTRTFQAAASQFMLAGLPLGVTSGLRGEPVTSLPPPTGGRLGAETARARNAFIEIGQLSNAMGDELTGLGFDVRAANAELKLAGLTQALSSVRSARELFDQLAACAAAVAEASSAAAATSGAGGVAAATCANAAVQAALIFDEMAIQFRIHETERELVFVTASDSIARRASSLEALSARLKQVTNEAHAALTELSMLRSQGRRALSRALFLDESDTGAVLRSNIILRRRLALEAAQYDRLRDGAVWAAFLAKRAIEQRFGVHLASLTENMSLVTAPATWESTLCEFEGVRYQDFSDPDPENKDLAIPANAFIGEYVDKLEQFVESYRIDFPFVNGEDTAVVSLRDDIQRVREACVQPSPNLLRYSENLNARNTSDQTGWKTYGCLTGVSGEELPNCIALTRLDDPNDDPMVDDPDYGPGVATESGTVVPYQVFFGPDHPGTCPGVDCPCPTSACGWTSTATYGQDVELRRGLHRVSWYAYANGVMEGAYEPAYNSVVSRALGSATQWSGGSSYGTSEEGNGWYRYWYYIDVPFDQAGRIEIRQIDSVASIRIGGLMLEDVEDLASSSIDLEIPPRTFFRADGNGEYTMRAACEDTDGDLFRSRGFERKCLRLCPEGFASVCDDLRATEYCFWETEFSVSQRAIDRGIVFASSSFARGNFNYRTESIGLNIVGSAARVCADENLPSTCYNAGFVPYSLEHFGPYRVRNYFGQEYDAPLFPGIIEHSRALATERYLTNPISAADRSLIEPYVQRQFRGRPLAGNYRLRIWDEPGVNFEGIEDVQVVLNYRYWTRSR